MTVVGGACVFIYYRYYFFGKIQSNWMDRIPEEKQIEIAKINKRNFGYENHYVPTLEISIKKKIQESMGNDYKRISRIEILSDETRTREQIMDEENNMEF